MKIMVKSVLAIIGISLLITSAVKAEIIGKVSTKGLIFKDKILIKAFDDPTIKGVTCYTTVYDRAFTFDEASDASLSCRKTGAIKGELSDRENVFSQSKNLFFKRTVVDRFYDKKRNVLVYISYTKDTAKGKNASHSLSVVVVGNAD